MEVVAAEAEVIAVEVVAQAKILGTEVPPDSTLDPTTYGSCAHGEGSAYQLWHMCHRFAIAALDQPFSILFGYSHEHNSK